MGIGDDRLDLHHSDRNKCSLESLGLQLKRIVRILFSCARAKWLHVISTVFIACVVMTAALHVIPPAYGGDILKAEGSVVLPIARKIVADLQNYLHMAAVNIGKSQDWKKAMRFDYLLLALMILGALLHAALVYAELNERLRRHVQKHLILWGAVVLCAAIIIVVPAVSVEIGSAFKA
jgi:hypothetical protein